MPAPTDSVEISAIPTSVVTAAGTDIHPVSQGGVTKQETNAQILSYIQGAIAIPLAQISDASANGRSLVAAANYAAMLTLLSAAPLASPTFTGVPAAPTAAPGTNTTQLATTAFVLANAGVGSVTNVTASAPLASSGGATPDISLTGTVAAARGGTGVSNAGTITNASNTTITGGGTLALGGFTATIPATLTVAGLAIANVFSAAQAITIADAVTNTVTTLATLTHNSSGTPAASFGSRLLFNLDSATVDDRAAGAIDVFWTVATDATRVAHMALYSATSGGVSEAIRLGGGGISALGGNTSATITAQAMNLVFGGGTVTYGNSGTGTGTNLVVKASATINTGQFVAFQAGTVELARFASEAGTVSTAAVVDNLVLRRNPTSGTPAAGTGQQIHFVGKTDTTANRDQLTISAEWVVATEASQTTLVKFNVFDTAAREAMRFQASGSAPMIGVLGAAAVIRQTGGENLTNNVASGGTDGTIANYTDLTIYANDAAAIRNNIYQLARMLKQDHDALRLYGFLT